MQLTVDAGKSKEMLFDPKEEHDACGVGFVVNSKGVRSNKVLKDAKVMLERMDHRGACACDEDTGDGAEYAREANVKLPPVGQFATGLIFVHNRTTKIPDLMNQFSEATEECNLELLFWRMVDVNKNCIGIVAHSEEPVIVQVFVVEKSTSQEPFESTGFRSKVFLLRKYASNELQRPVIYAVYPLKRLFTKVCLLQSNCGIIMQTYAIQIF
ncbi:unnamed protein product [Heterobilharzia americana]|nr:unnamed protein product [Heterobilharzia americana]